VWAAREVKVVGEAARTRLRVRAVNLRLRLRARAAPRGARAYVLLRRLPVRMYYGMLFWQWR